MSGSTFGRVEPAQAVERLKVQGSRIARQQMIRWLMMLVGFSVTVLVLGDASAIDAVALGVIFATSGSLAGAALDAIAGGGADPLER
jgi:hypothetical protein